MNPDPARLTNPRRDQLASPSDAIETTLCSAFFSTGAATPPVRRVNQLGMGLFLEHFGRTRYFRFAGTSGVSP